MEIVLVFLCILTTGTSLSVHKECFVTPARLTELTWTGSHIDITSWIPEIDPKEMLSSSPVLSLTLKFSERAEDNNFDRIAIWPSKVSLTRNRNNILNQTTLDITTQIGPGWTDFNFTAEGQFEAWHKQSGTKLASMSKEAEITTVFIVGTNVTINCHHLDIGWEITNGETKVIPFSWEVQDHHFSFFSNKPIKPNITLGEESLIVAWYGNSLVDSAVLKVEHQHPLPLSEQHWFTLTCREKERVCIVKGKQEIKTFKFGKYDALPASMSIAADNTAFIYFHRPSPPAPTEMILPHILINENTGLVGYIVAIIVLFVLLCAVLGVGVAFFIKRETGYNKNRYNEEQIRESVRAVLQTEASQLLRSRSISNSDVHLEPRMWSAVAENDARYVEFLLGKGYNPNDPEKGRPTTPFVEAHILGRSDILQVIAAQNKEESAAEPQNEFIVQIMNEMTHRMKAIFKSAAYGMYKQEQGVKLLLLNNFLPGTIRDHKGRSFLHYMASNSFMDGRPAWEAQDIEDFLLNHECYVNAIDHWGNTALHSLAMRCREEEKKVFWNGKEQTLSEAWLAMADFLLGQGCDPRIANHQGLLSHQLATDRGNHDIAKLFKRKCDTLGQADLQKAMSNFPNLVTAAQKGDTKVIKKLLMDNVPLLPMFANSDPLVEAIRYRQRDAVFLLLCAGSPLCNRSIEDLTPLETAHSTFGIPACFPALMRKAYRDKLQSEISKVSEDESLKPLHQGMQDFILQIKENGSGSRWKFKETDYSRRSTEARNLLVQAATLGLSLTCQLLALEDVSLHPYPNEQKPFEMAIMNKHVDTQYVLYRDLKMSPHIIPSSLKMLSPVITEHRWISALMFLEKICTKKDSPDLCGESGSIILQYIENLREHEGIWKEEQKVDSLQEPPPILLHLLGKYGLDTILNTLLKCKDLKINDIIQPFSKCTLIHVAAMYGQLNMIEFLIYNGANLSLKTISGLSPAHLAALRGHKECMHYLLTYMESQGKDIGVKCRSGYTAKEFMNMYENFCKESLSPLLNHMDALHIKNRKDIGDQAYEQLKRKSKLLNILDAKSFLNCAAEKNMSKDKSEAIQRNVNEIAEQICGQINDERFLGEVKPAGDLHEGNGMFNVIESCVIYELSQFHAIGPSAPVTCKDVLNKNNEATVEIESDNYPNLFNGINFRETFCKTVENIIAKDGDLGPGIIITPPFVTPFNKGVKIFSVWTIGNAVQFMRIKIVPCLKTKLPQDSRLLTLPQDCLRNLTDDCVHLQLKNIQGEWHYRAFNHENCIWSSLNQNQKTVWLSCRLILLLLKKLWWAPHFNTKRYKKTCHTMSLGVSQPYSRAIKALFLEEMTECSDWNESDLFERVYGIFKRAAEKDEHNQWVPKKTLNSFLTPSNYCSCEFDSIVGIMYFLDELKSKNNSTPSVELKSENEVSPKVTFGNM